MTITGDYLTSQSGAITSGDFTFQPPPNIYVGPTLRADTLNGVSGGTVDFRTSALLHTTHLLGVSGGLQRFYDSSTLQTTTATGIGGGQQEFYGTSSLRSQAGGGVSGGTQTFHEQSTFFAQVGGAVTGGTQNFVGTASKMEISARSGVFGGEQKFYGTAYLLNKAEGGVASGTQSFFDAAHLETGLVTGENGNRSSVVAGSQKFFNSSYLHSEWYNGVAGGLQQFYDDSHLDASGWLSVNGGTQAFYDSAHLEASGGSAVAGGLQFFYDHSALNLSGSVQNYEYARIVGGAQVFFDSSTLRVGMYRGVDGGQQSFYGNSSLAISGRGSIKDGALYFADNASLILSEGGSVESGTLTFTGHSQLRNQGGGGTGDAVTLRDNSEVNSTSSLGFYHLTFDGSRGGTGGTVSLGGHNMNVGILDSVDGSGRITNAFANDEATVTVNRGNFGGIISDGPIAAPALAAAGRSLAAFSFGAAVSLSVVGTRSDLQPFTLSGANAYTGTTRVTDGILRLDFSTAHSPAENIISPQSDLILGLGTNDYHYPSGGTLELLGKSGATNTQTFTSLHLEDGSSFVKLNPNGATRLDVDFGNYADFARFRGSAIDLTLSGSSTAALAGAPEGTFGFATMNGQSTWAHFHDGAITPFTSYDSTWAPGNNTDVSSALSATTNPGPDATTGTLRFNEAAANTVTLAGTTLIEKGGILVTASVGNHLSTITGGVLAAPPGEDLIITQANTANVLRIESQISPQGSQNVVTKNGPGKLVLAADNVYGNFITLAGNIDIEHTVQGDVAASNGGSVGGNGTVTGKTTINLGGRLKPGRSPGNFTTGSAEWGQDGIYEWEVNDATGLLGTDPGWDLFSVVGALDITATADHPYTIKVLSLGLDNLPGEATDFDPAQPYSWIIATAGGGVSLAGTPITDLSEFAPDLFAIDRSGFTNTADGTFALTLDPTLHDLLLTYTAPAPVPEPGTAFFGLVAAAGLLRRQRHRK